MLHSSLMLFWMGVPAQGTVYASQHNTMACSDTRTRKACGRDFPHVLCKNLKARACVSVSRTSEEQLLNDVQLQGCVCLCLCLCVCVGGGVSRTSEQQLPDDIQLQSGIACLGVLALQLVRLIEHRSSPLEPVCAQAPPQGHRHSCMCLSTGQNAKSCTCSHILQGA